MTIHSMPTANRKALSHADADAVRMLILGLSQDAEEGVSTPPRTGQARIVVHAGFPTRQVLTMGHARPA